MKFYSDCSLCSGACQGHEGMDQKWSAEYDGRTIGSAVRDDPTDTAGNAEVLMGYLGEHARNNPEHVPDFIKWYHKKSQSQNV